MKINGLTVEEFAAKHHVTVEDVKKSLDTLTEKGYKITGEKSKKTKKEVVEDEPEESISIETE